MERLTIDALSVLVRKAMRLRSAAGELLLADPGPALRKVIERTGTGPLLSAFPDSAAALRALAGDGRTWQRVGLAPGRVPCSLSPRRRDATDRDHRAKELQQYVTGWGAVRCSAQKTERATKGQPVKHDAPSGNGGEAHHRATGRDTPPRAGPVPAGPCTRGGKLAWRPWAGNGQARLLTPYRRHPRQARRLRRRRTSATPPSSSTPLAAAAAPRCSLPVWASAGTGAACPTTRPLPPAGDAAGGAREPTSPATSGGGRCPGPGEPVASCPGGR
ncbi:hypothetical protein [Streptomyces sp. NPDC018045]|uniref:hypothetical protein n=1 Tax=Streptomyces sp. NPDC018045 TaxID=3365037 RepID=UPI00379EECE8